MRLSPHLLAGGVLWAVAYNSIWGLAWFAFMRGEWLHATTAFGRGMPWTEIWVVSVALTLPLGVATMVYVAGRADTKRRPHPALAASFALWLPMTMGMTGWGWIESLSARILVLDAAVNLLAIAAAGIAAARWHGRLTRA